MKGIVLKKEKNDPDEELLSLLSDLERPVTVRTLDVLLEDFDRNKIQRKLRKLQKYGYTRKVTEKKCFFWKAEDSGGESR